MLFNEPKLLKYVGIVKRHAASTSFSALQRAEIAEMCIFRQRRETVVGFSALQRAEIAEITKRCGCSRLRLSFSALQRAEIAEIVPALSDALGRRFQCSSTSRNC